VWQRQPATTESSYPSVTHLLQGHQRGVEWVVIVVSRAATRTGWSVCLPIRNRTHQGSIAMRATMSSMPLLFFRAIASGLPVELVCCRVSHQGLP
jgi:hypothetical protein